MEWLADIEKDSQTLSFLSLGEVLSTTTHTIFSSPSHRYTDTPYLFFFCLLRRWHLHHHPPAPSTNHHPQNHHRLPPPPPPPHQNSSCAPVTNQDTPQTRERNTRPPTPLRVARPGHPRSTAARRRRDRRQTGRRTAPASARRTR